MEKYSKDTSKNTSRKERILTCYSCKKGILVRRQAKSNKQIFYGCSNWPTCKNMWFPK